MITAYKAGSISAVFRLSQTTLTTWASATGSTWRGLCRDMETGDFVVGDWTTGRLLRIDHYTRKVTTIASGLGAITGVAYVPRSGRFAVTRGSHANGLVIVRSDGHVTNEIPLANAEAVCVREDTGDIHACGYGVIVSVSDLGSVRSTHAWPGYVFTGIEVYGKRPLSLTASGRLGTKQNVKIRFTRSPGALYVCALSFAHRPGLAIGHDRVLHLRPDALFQLTLGRDILGITERFIGITQSGTGFAYPAFTLPASFPHGICVYVAGAALNPTFPGGLDFSNTGVVRTWTAVVRPLPMP